MKRDFRRNWTLPFALTSLLFSPFLYNVDSAGAKELPPGVVFEIYAGKSGLGGQYLPGRPIPITMVVRNVSGEDITTRQGFSTNELYRSLMVTAPGRKSWVWSEGDGADPPPSLFWKNRPAVPVEILPAGWKRSILIRDLYALFTDMKKTLGWYTIQGRQPFARFASSVKDDRFGMLGVMDDPHNFYGTLDSNRLQVLVSAPQGGKPQVRVINKSGPLDQVPVRVFFTSRIPAKYGLGEVWSKVEPVLEGRTGIDGRTDWGPNPPCLPKDDYTIISYCRGQFMSAQLKKEEKIWLPDCSGPVKKEIVLKPR